MTDPKTFTPNLVTVDGPAASGKSSLSRTLAKSFGWKWVSTGAFYRALAYVARQRGVDLGDEEGLVRLAESSCWRVELDEERTRVYLQRSNQASEQDVTDRIYQESVGSDASRISQFQGVRKSLLEAQRQCAVGVQGLVAEGRDCGTVIFPQAPVKIYLTAASDSRAQRRAQEQDQDWAEIQRAQIQRDRQDSTRKAAPLQIPEGAEVIDSSNMSLEQVVQEAEKILRKKLLGL